MRFTSLVQALRSSNPRESAGSQTAGRYDFQTNFAILKLIELQQEGRDYCVVFDLFDDIMILDSADEPAEARFYQIKSKDPGSWNSGGLCAKNGAKPPRSYVARLYAHVEAFGDAVVETGFVSNAAFALYLSDGTTTSGTHHFIVGSQLHSREVAKITKAVLADLPAANMSSWLPKLSFVRTTLGVHGQRQTVIGHLQDHLEKCSDSDNFKTGALYNTLHASITERTTFSVKGLTYEAFMPRKSLTRDEFNALIARALSRPRGFLQDWETVTTDLKQAGMGTPAQIRIKTAASAYIADRLSGRSPTLKLSETLRNWFAANEDVVLSAASVLSLADSARVLLTDTCGYADTKLIGACLVEAYEAINEE